MKETIPQSMNCLRLHAPAVSDFRYEQIGDKGWIDSGAGEVSTQGGVR